MPGPRPPPNLPNPPSTPPSPPPAVVFAPVDTVRIRGQGVPLWFQGHGLQAGDDYKWVPFGSECGAARFRDVADFGSTQDSGLGQVGIPRFVVFKVGLFSLCYRFNYANQTGALPGTPRVDGTSFILFEGIRLVVLEVGSFTPNGTALGCVSTVNITGTGFTLLNSLSFPPRVTCNFGLYAVDPILRTYDKLSCRTPGYARPLSMVLSVQFGTHFTWPLTDPFYAYNNSLVRVDRVFPGGGAYNLDAMVTVAGFMGVNYGQLS